MLTKTRARNNDTSNSDDFTGIEKMSADACIILFHVSEGYIAETATNSYCFLLRIKTKNAFLHASKANLFD